MKQALHIFKKDLRHLRWEIGISLALMVVFVYTQFHRGPFRDMNGAMEDYLLLSFWAFLCARLIQAEPIPGDRQFWITRPYQWRSLLGAKLLFMLTIIGLPLLAADAIVLGLNGFSIPAYTVGLMWSLLLITASTLIAFCAFATLTRSLTEWFLTAIVTVGVIYVIAAIANERVWAGVEWSREYVYVAVMFMAAVAVLLRQYRRRGMVASIALMATGLLGSSLFVNYSHAAWALDLEARFSKPNVDPSSIRIEAQPVAHTRPFSPLGRQEVILVAIPIDISGLGAGLDLISDEIGVALTNAGGEIWTRTGRQANSSNYLQHLLKGYRLLLQMDRSAFEKAHGRPVNLNVTLYLTMLRDEASRVIRPDSGAVDVPGVGRCRDLLSEGGSWILCESPLRRPPNVLVVGFDDQRRDRFLTGTSYSPFPADANSALVPLSRYSHSRPQDGAPATLTSLKPVAHFRRDLELREIHLDDYRLMSPF